MTVVRTGGPTPHGGDHTIAVYVDLDTLKEVDEAKATGLIISEYAGDEMLFETVGRIDGGLLDHLGKS